MTLGAYGAGLERLMGQQAPPSPTCPEVTPDHEGVQATASFSNLLWESPGDLAEAERDMQTLGLASQPHPAACGKAAWKCYS